jgi:hypothetical protein
MAVLCGAEAGPGVHVKTCRFCAVDEIMAAFARSEYRFPALIIRVIKKASLTAPVL